MSEIFWVMFLLCVSSYNEGYTVVQLPVFFKDEESIPLEWKDASPSRSDCVPGKLIRQKITG
jgi:hypothetical protein